MEAVPWTAEQLEAAARRGMLQEKYAVFLIRGSTVGLFLGGPGPPVPVISGRFLGVPGVRAGITNIRF